MENSLQNLVESILEEGKYTQLLHQLKKDITRAGLEQEFDLGDNPATLGRKLVAQLYALIISDFESYLNLLYLIDISEDRIKKLQVEHVHELAQAISFLILQRERQKIAFRS